MTIEISDQPWLNARPVDHKFNVLARHVVCDVVRYCSAQADCPAADTVHGNLPSPASLLRQTCQHCDSLITPRQFVSLLLLFCVGLLVAVFIRAADQLKILMAINRAIKKFNRD